MKKTIQLHKTRRSKWFTMFCKIDDLFSLKSKFMYNRFHLDEYLDAK